MNLIQTIVEIARLEMVRLSRNFLSGHVVNIGVSHCQSADCGFKALRSAIVEYDNTELVVRIVLVEGTSNSIQDKVVVLTAASDEHIDGWHVVPPQSQLGPVSPLHGHHSPAVVHQRGDCNRKFHGDKNPGGSIRCVVSTLRQSHADDAECQITNVQSGVGKGQKRQQCKQMAFPPPPNILIITLGDDIYAFAVAPILAIMQLLRLFQQTSEADVALVLQNLAISIKSFDNQNLVANGRVIPYHRRRRTRIRCEGDSKPW